MGDNLPKFAGSKFRYYIEKYTSNPILGAIVSLLFTGLEMMGNALQDLQYVDGFQSLIVRFSAYPLLATLAGALITGVVQSSSAVVGIIQVLYSKEVITLYAAVGLTFGANIGTTVTGALACLSTASLSAKRISLFHLIFNVIVSLLFLILIEPFVYCLIGISDYFALNKLMTVAVGHFLFNLIGMLIFCRFVSKLCMS